MQHIILFIFKINNLVLISQTSVQSKQLALGIGDPKTHFKMHISITLLFFSSLKINLDLYEKNK